MYEKLCELEKKIGAEDTSVEEEDQGRVNFIESWQVLDAKLSSNMTHLIFNYYDSDFEGARKQAATIEEKRKISYKKSKVLTVVKDMIKYGSGESTGSVAPKPSTIEGYENWKNEVMNFSNACFKGVIDKLHSGGFLSEDQVKYPNNIKMTTLGKLMSKLKN